MKKILSIAITLVLSITVIAQEEEGKRIPAVQLKNLNGETLNTAEISNNGKPTIISFWATWCSPCKLELNTIHEEYLDWVDETGVKLVAVSIDDERTKNRIGPYVDGRGWEYEILLDTNADLKRALGVTNVPHTFLLDGNGEIVYSHNGYAPGDEEELYERVLELVQEHK
ncbi:MAG: TlpA family protein disulfide reductase [Lishizhenia sp.]